jgi:Cu2+-exporting ATPase
VKLVEDAQKIKSKTQNFADRAAKVLTFVALGGGVITLSCLVAVRVSRLCLHWKEWLQ